MASIGVPNHFRLGLMPDKLPCWGKVCRGESGPWTGCHMGSMFLWSLFCRLHLACPGRRHSRDSSNPVSCHVKLGFLGPEVSIGPTRGCGIFNCEDDGSKHPTAVKTGCRLRRGPRDGQRSLGCNSESLDVWISFRILLDVSGAAI